MMFAIPTIQVRLTAFAPGRPDLMGALNLAALNLANSLGRDRRRDHPRRRLGHPVHRLGRLRPDLRRPPPATSLTVARGRPPPARDGDDTDRTPPGAARAGPGRRRRPGRRGPARAVPAPRRRPGPAPHPGEGDPSRSTGRQGQRLAEARVAAGRQVQRSSGPGGRRGRRRCR